MYIISALGINSITLTYFSEYCVSAINMQVNKINLQFAKITNFKLVCDMTFNLLFDVDKGEKRDYNF